MKNAPMDDERAADGGAVRPRFTWKKVALVVVALAILGSVVQVFLHSGSKGAINTTGNGSSVSGSAVPNTAGKSTTSGKSTPGKASGKASGKGTPTASVTLGGHGIAAAGQAIIVLNPGLVSPGGKVNISGSGFDPGATVDIALTGGNDKKGTSIAMSKTDKDGSISTNVTMPTTLPGSNASIVATQRGGNKSATAQVGMGGGTGFLTLNKTTGKPGDKVAISASGFTPGETVDAYWAKVSGDPSAKFTADGGGAVGKASVPVGVAPVGPTTLVLIGEKSKTAATAVFQMLGLYPTVTTTPYALKAGDRLAVSGAGFAPGEQILLYVNASGGTPALTANADSQGNMAIQFAIPFGLKGTQSVTLIGADSRASVASGFSILPYSPVVQASTYGALPGTSISFYASGFAPNEVVQVYTGKGQGNNGNLVTAFRVDAKGNAAAQGSYVIPSDAQKGITFTLVGRQSEGTGTASVTVDAPKQPVTVPPQPSYSMPSDLATDPAGP